MLQEESLELVNYIFHSSSGDSHIGTAQLPYYNKILFIILNIINILLFNILLS